MENMDIDEQMANIMGFTNFDSSKVINLLIFNYEITYQKMRN